MACTKKTQKSWLNRMSSAFIGLVVGLAMFAGGTWLLYWNEGRGVATAGVIGEARLVTVEMPDVTKIDPALEGKMVHATGFADTNDVLTDDFSGYETTAISLKRQAEYYQWVESSKSETFKKSDGGEETITTYSYKQEWTNRPVNSSGFKDLQYVNVNTVLTTVPTEMTSASSVSFGAYQLPAFILRGISETTPSALDLTPEVIEGMNGRMFPNAGGQTCVHSQNNVIYLGLSPSSPQIGDVRVTYTEVRPANISILAQVSRNTFEPFRASNNKTFSKVSVGTVGAEDMFGDAIAGNTALTWGLRAAGALLVVIALRMLMAPIVVLADVIPILGAVVGAGAVFVAFVAGIAWSLIIIATVWLRFRPLIGGGLLVATAAALFFLFRFRRKKKLE